MRWIGAMLPLLFSSLCLMGCGDESTPIETPPLGDEFDVESTHGVSLHVTTYGNAEAPKVVVLLHGGPGLSSAYMRPFEVLASDGQRVVRYDQRGVGESTSPVPPSFTIDDYAHDLEAIRKAMGVARFQLVAHDWGALVAWSYLTLYPANVGSLAFIGGWAPNAAANQTGFGNARDQVTFLQQSGLIPNPVPPDNGDDCSPGYVAKLPAYMHNPEAALPSELATQPCRRSVEVQTTQAVFAVPFEYAGVGAGFTGRALVLFGNNDPHGGEIADATANALPMASPELEVLPSCGHYPWFEIDIVGRVRTFLASVP